MSSIHSSSGYSNFPFAVVHEICTVAERPIILVKISRRSWRPEIEKKNFPFVTGKSVMGSLFSPNRFVRSKWLHWCVAPTKSSQLNMGRHTVMAQRQRLHATFWTDVHWTVMERQPFDGPNHVIYSNRIVQPKRYDRKILCRFCQRSLCCRCSPFMQNASALSGRTIEQTNE